MSGSYWNEDDADRLAAVSSKDYLAGQLIKTHNEAQRLKGSLDTARHIIALLVVIVVALILVSCAEPSDLYLWISDDYHGDIIGPFQ